jgi:hypothetical protein
MEISMTANQRHVEESSKERKLAVSSTVHFGICLRASGHWVGANKHWVTVMGHVLKFNAQQDALEYAIVELELSTDEFEVKPV